MKKFLAEVGLVMLGGVIIAILIIVTIKWAYGHESYYFADEWRGYNHQPWWSHEATGPRDDAVLIQQELHQENLWEELYWQDEQKKYAPESQYLEHRR